MMLCSNGCHCMFYKMQWQVKTSFLLTCLSGICLILHWYIKSFIKWVEKCVLSIELSQESLLHDSFGWEEK